MEIGGIAQAVFTEVSGLQLEMEVMEYQEGGNNDFVHRLPGRTKSSNLTLKRGMTNSNEFFQWYAELAQGKDHAEERLGGDVRRNGQRVARWN